MVFFWFSSAESWLAAPDACAGSVVGLQCVALLRGAYTGRVDGLWCVELLPHRWGSCRDELLPRAELLVMMVLMVLMVLMLACWRPAFLSRCRWAACGPVGGGTEVVGAGWLVSVLVCRWPAASCSV
jgi:hypothetical protein